MPSLWRSNSQWVVAGLVFALQIAPVQAESSHWVHVNYWVEGQSVLKDQRVVVAHEPWVFENARYRVELSLEPNEDSWVPTEAVWLKVTLYESSSSEDGWQYLTDGLVSALPGQPASFSVTDRGQKPSPSNSDVYFEATVEPLDE